MDSTLNSLTAKTPGAAALLYGAVSPYTTGLDRKVSMTAAGAQMLEAANVAAQITLLNAATLGANTFTALQTNSFSVAASTPAHLFTGSLYTGGTGTTTLPAILFEPAGTTAATNWSSGANNGTFFGINAASAGYTGNFIDFKRAGGPTSSFKVGGGGEVTCGSIDCSTFRTTGYVWLNTNGGIIYFGASSDVQLHRDAAATLQMGADHATTATSQTIKAHDVTTGTGASLTLAGGKGSVAGGAVILATSATNGAPATAVTVDNNGVTMFAKPAVLPGYTVAGLPATAANGAVQGAHAFVTDATAPTYLGALTGGGAVVCPVFYNGSAWVSH